MKLCSSTILAITALAFFPCAAICQALPPTLGAGTPAAYGVRKLSDADLGCQAIQDEVAQLDQEATLKREQSAALNADFRKSQEELIASMRSSAPSTAGMGLLNMLPGGAIAGSLMAQSASSNRMAATADYNRKMQSMQQSASQAQADLSRAEARKDYLIGLYMQKGCRLPAPAAAAPARSE